MEKSLEAGLGHAEGTSLRMGEGRTMPEAIVESNAGAVTEKQSDCGNLIITSTF